MVFFFKLVIEHCFWWGLGGRWEVVLKGNLLSVHSPDSYG